MALRPAPVFALSPARRLVAPPPPLLALALALALAIASGPAGAAASSAAVVGGKKAVAPQDLRSPDVLAAAEAVMLEVERSSSRKLQPALLGLTRVLAASKQVVAGVLWELEVELSPTTCPRHKDMRVDPAAELRERCKQNDQFARVFEATALHRAWIKEAPWTVTVKRFRDAGKGDWQPFQRTVEAISEAERERLIAEDKEAAAEQVAADQRRAAIAAAMSAHAAQFPDEEDDKE